MYHNILNSRYLLHKFHLVQLHFAVEARFSVMVKAGLFVGVLELGNTLQEVL